MALCDIPSVYFKGLRCPLAKRGYSRAGKQGKLQFVFAWLCDQHGCPAAVEVFEVNPAKPGTVGTQVHTLHEPVSLSRVVQVGDRGLLTDAGIGTSSHPPG